MPFVLALLSAGVYGVADFLGGLAARRAPVVSVTFASQLIGLLGLAALLAFSGVRDPARVDLSWGAAAGVAGGVGVALLYLGLATGVASVVAPITAVCSIAVPVAVGLMLGERPSLFAIAGIGLAALAVVLLSRSEGPTNSAASARGRAARSIPIALGAGVAIGAFLACLGRTRSESGLWPLLAARAVSVTGFALLCLTLRHPAVPARGARATTTGAGLLDVLANALFVAAVQRGPLGLVATLASLYPASTVALAHRVLGERLGPPQKVGLGLALGAIVLITLPTG